MILSQNAPGRLAATAKQYTISALTNFDNHEFFPIKLEFKLFFFSFLYPCNSRIIILNSSYQDMTPTGTLERNSGFQIMKLTTTINY